MTLHSVLGGKESGFSIVFEFSVVLLNWFNLSCYSIRRVGEGKGVFMPFP